MEYLFVDNDIKMKIISMDKFLNFFVIQSILSWEISKFWVYPHCLQIRKGFLFGHIIEIHYPEWKLKKNLEELLQWILIQLQAT